jgi:hypothetical protein
MRCLMHAHKRMQIHETCVYASRILRTKRAHKTRQGTFGLCQRERSNIGSANAEHNIPCADACDDARAQNGRCVRPPAANLQTINLPYFVESASRSAGERILH